MTAPADVNGDNYGNSENVEVAWAIKAYHHAETYFNLISSLDSTQLKLTKHDDELYTHFKEDFPNMSIDVINEQELKSEEAKKRWRPFCNHFDGTIADFNFGTLLRLNCAEDYSEHNSIFVTRVQFFAIEVARNREGLNLCVRKTSKHKGPMAAADKAVESTKTDAVTDSGDAQKTEVTASS